MRKLGEQWVEEIDGKSHMLKAVNYSEGCNGCIFLRYDSDEFYTCERGRLSCPVDDETIVKDLGILNDEGMLSSPFPDGGYPTIQRGANWDGEGWVDCYWAVYKAHKIYICTGQFPTEQEAIDAWNRRA